MFRFSSTLRLTKEQKSSFQDPRSRATVIQQHITAMNMFTRERWFRCADIAGKRRILKVFHTEKNHFMLNMKR